MSRELATARSWLFVPGTRPDRFQKALEAGADWIVLDLEDAVAPTDKPAARANVDNWLSEGNVGVVRINAHDTPWYADDREMVDRHRCPVMVPKVASPEDIFSARSHLQPETALIPLIESAAAVLAVAAICAQAGVVRVAFGSFDLGAELGLAPEKPTAFLFARSAIVLGAAASGLAPPIDGVTGDVTSVGPLQVDIAHARELGFGGKLCIHPNQVPHVNTGFMPADEEVRWARRVLAQMHDDNLAVVDGKMIDAPVLARARRIAAAADGD